MIIESGEHTSLGNSPFKSEAWLKGLNTSFKIFKAISSNNEVASIALNFTTLSKAGLLKIDILSTPMWALDCGLSPHVNSEAFLCLLGHISNEKASLKVVDLPPSINDDLIKSSEKFGYKIKWRHTRQLELPSNLTGNRRKQLRRAAKEGIVGTESKSVLDEVIRLHKQSRDRKNVHHDENSFKALLKSISTLKDFFMVTVSNTEGELMASGGFLIIDNKTCLYAFGGQVRSKNSGLASVVLIDEAIKAAEKRGCTVFDFGGSQDEGVDNFYKGFGANAVPKARLIKASWWLNPILKIVRPDLA